MFWIPLFSVIIELGQLVQEPCSFSLTTPPSKPRYRTSPPSSCTVGLVMKNVSKSDNNRKYIHIYCHCTYLIRVSRSSFIIATSSSSSSDGAKNTWRYFSAVTNIFIYLFMFIYTMFLIIMPTCILNLLATLTDNWKPRCKKVHNSSKDIWFDYFPIYICINLDGKKNIVNLTFVFAMFWHGAVNRFYLWYGDEIWAQQHTFDTIYSKQLSVKKIKHF